MYSYNDCIFNVTVFESPCSLELPNSLRRGPTLPAYNAHTRVFACIRNIFKNLYLHLFVTYYALASPAVGH